MITRDEMLRLRDEAKRTMALKAEQALAGHDFVVASHTLSSWQLAELLHCALLGERVRRMWHDQTKSHLPPDFDVLMIVAFPDAPGARRTTDYPS